MLGFPDSLGLWPLRLVAAWPGEIGRAVGALLCTGRLGPLALSQSAGFQLNGATANQLALATALGLVAQLAAGLALFWLAERPRPARALLFALAGCCGLAALLPPQSTVSAAELGAALALALLGWWRSDAAPRVGLQFLAGVMVISPLAELRPELLSTGRASGAVGILTSQSGVPSAAWALLIAAFIVAGLFVLLRHNPGKVRAS
jgi:zinc transporter ZupT